MAMNCELILDQINKFLKYKDKKNFSMLSNKTYFLYCNQIKKITIIGDLENRKLKNILDKYNNIRQINMFFCKNIHYFNPPKLDKLEVINLCGVGVEDISFLYNYKNIKKLTLEKCEKIQDFNPISKLNELELLNLSYTNISDISFLENNKNLKNLYLNECDKITNFNPLSKLVKLEILELQETKFPDIYILKENKNIKRLNLRDSGPYGLGYKYQDYLEIIKHSSD